jgi:hypothetical protein
MARAFCAKPVNRYLKPYRLETSRQSDVGRAFIRHINIEHLFAGIAIKVAMLPHIRAKPRRAPVHRHLPRATRAYQRIQAIINRRHRNLRHPPLGANKNFFRRRMIPLLDQHAIDMLPLRREAKAARRELLAQMLIRFFMLDSGHRSGKLSVTLGAVNT